MLNIPNPFPQLGTPSENIKINPVGYDIEIEKIKNLVTTNITKQPIIVNIYGEYGQGKTTFLKYLKEKFMSDWGNFCVFEKDISNFPNLENDLVLYQKAKEKNKKKGIFLILDEMKHVSTERELTKDQEDFLVTLRQFADGTIEGVNSENFALCLAMHPETKVFLRDSGHYDVEQRKGTFSVNLKDVDYYTAYMLVKEHLLEMSHKDPSIVADYAQYFDESFINAFYVLLSYVEEQNEGLKRFNGRTFSQIMFTLFEFYKEKGSKLTFDDLKDILLGKYEETLKLKDAELSLKDKNQYYLIYDLLNNEEKYIFDRFLFNPRWHFDSEFENVEKYVIERLIKKEYITQREAILLSSKTISKINDNEIIEGLKTLEKERIFRNGEKLIYFIDLADQKLLNKLKEFKKNRVYRLDNYYLNRIYGFEREKSISRELIEYFKSDPSKKVNIFLDNFNRNILNFANFLSSNIKKFKKSDIKYKYLDVEYEIIGDIRHRMAIFFYGEEYSSSGFQSYYKDLISELEESSYDLGVLFIGPYYTGELPKSELIIRKMENRLFIHHFSRNEFISFLNDNLDDIDDLVKESVKLYTQEAVEKGFTLPLTGFKEKIKNKPSLFRDMFISDIEKGWKMDITEFETVEKAGILKNGVDGDGKLLRLATDSLKDFIILDDGNFIKGSKLSKYEKNFIDLFGNTSVPIDEIRAVKERYFSYYSRFDMEDYMTRILEKKSFLRADNERYILVKPTDFLHDIVIALNSVDILELANKDQDINFKRKIFDFKFLLEKLKNGISKYETGSYNYQMEKILNNIKNLEKGDKTEFSDVDRIYKDLKQKFDFELGNLSIKDVDISNYLENMKNLSEFSDFYQNINTNKLDLNKIHEIIVSILIHEIELEVDIELLSALEDILDRIELFNIDNLSHSLNDLRENINKIKAQNVVEDPGKYNEYLSNLFSGSQTDLTSSEVKVVKQILLDLDSYIIKPVYNLLNLSTSKFNNIIEIKDAVNTYNALFKELNTFKRRDIYLDNVKSVNINTNTIQAEIDHIETIAEHNPEIVVNYINFISDNCEKGQIESVLSVEKDIKVKEKKDILNYLKYVKNLNSLDYFIHYVTKNISDNEVSEDELIKLISKIKDSEDEYKNSDSKLIIDKILYNGSLRRFIYLEEYYKNNELFKNKNITYRVEGV